MTDAGSPLQALKMTRVYADAEGETHLAQLALPAEPSRGGGRSREVADIPTTTLSITEMHERRPTRDLHPPPRRQLVVILRGEFEVATTAGARTRFGPGDCLFVDDLDGRGHAFDDVGIEPLVTLQIGIDGNWSWPGT
jgi:hypothetical protein